MANKKSVKTNKIFNHWAFQLFVALVIVWLAVLLGFEKWAGPHAECSYNFVDVGPCDYWGRIHWGLPIVLMLAVQSWAILSGSFVILQYLFAKKRSK